MSNSTQADEIIRLTAIIEDHEKRIASLESQLSALVSRIAGTDYDGFMQSDYSEDDYFGDSVPALVQQVTNPPRRGRRPRIAPEEFARRRDDMVVFIEIRWPWLVEAFHERESLESILQAIKDASPGAGDAWPYRQIIDHLAELWEFLNSPRYRGEPRNIAYAMAGLPELTLRSSLDLGTKNPSALSLRLPAFADHIRRHNPTCWTVLTTQGVTSDALKLLRTCCPDCKRLASNPDQVQMALARGQTTR